MVNMNDSMFFPLWVIQQANIIEVEIRIPKIDGQSKQRWRKYCYHRNHTFFWMKEWWLIIACPSLGNLLLSFMSMISTAYSKPLRNFWSPVFTPLVYNHKCKLVIKITSLPQTSRVDVCNNCCWNQHFRQWNQRHWIHHWWNGTFQVTKVEIAIFMAFKSGFIRIEA